MSLRRTSLIVLPIAALLAAIAYGGRTQHPPERLDVSSFAPVYDVMRGRYEAQQLPPAEAPLPVAGAIVPHHLTAAEAIAAGIKALPPDTRTVLLLSPDHFDACPTLLCTAPLSFSTATGDVDGDAALGRMLARSPLVTEMPGLFRREHGISAVLPFIASDLPGTRVVPVVVSQRAGWRRSSGALLDALRPLLAAGAVPVVSSDFSHYLAVAAADRMDEQTMLAVLSADAEGIAALQNPQQSDCPACLWAITRLAGEGGFLNPSVLLHTNSARIIGDLSAPETTSHFAVAYYRNALLSADDLAVAGDVTVTRGDALPLSARMRAFWEGAGPRLVNLEGPVRETCAAHPNPYVFCNPLESVRRIAGTATHWGVENNHMLDLGADGPAETARLLRAIGEQPVDGRFTDAGAFRVLAVTLVMNPAPDGSKMAWAPQAAAVEERIRSAPPGRPILVLVHGGTEYQALASPAERAALMRFVDAGAAAVVQAHAHVPGSLWYYRGAPVLEGLGNFLFDQPGAATSTAMAVRLRPKGGSVLTETLRTR